MKHLSFAEQAAELHQLEAVARSLGLSEAAFERIALDVTAEAWIAGDPSPEQQLAEIRRRIHVAVLAVAGPLHSHQACKL